MRNLGFKLSGGMGGGGEAKVVCQNLMEQDPILYLLGTEISSVDEAWLVK